MATYHVVQEVMVVMRSKKGVVSLHLVVDWDGHAEAGIELRRSCLQPHRVLIVLLANGLLLLPLLAVLPVENGLAEGLEAVQVGEDGLGQDGGVFSPVDLEAVDLVFNPLVGHRNHLKINLVTSHLGSNSNEVK